MNFPGPPDQKYVSCVAAFAAVTLIIWLTCVTGQAQCTGLHAAITAQIVQLGSPYTEPSHVQLTFLLINDSDSSIDVRPKSWKIVVDGVELADSGWIFGNGPMPQDGWKPLQPGQYYELGKALPTDKYFTHQGEHTVLWRGEGFHSATIAVKISPHH